jgi:hypothetical protein
MADHLFGAVHIVNVDTGAVVKSRFLGFDNFYYISDANETGVYLMDRDAKVCLRV